MKTLKHLTSILLVLILILPITTNPASLLDTPSLISVPEEEPLIEIAKRKSEVIGYFKNNIHSEDITDIECLAFAMYGEARGEPRLGMTAVAFVIHNRLMNKKRWGHESYCNVVKHKGQFSFQIRKPKNEKELASWNSTLELANYLIIDEGFDKLESPVHNAMFFNSLSSQEEWLKNRTFIIKIGNHYFYK